MSCSTELPLTDDALLEARARGFNKTSAPNTMASKIPPFDHKPLLQTMMDQRVQSYQSPCWTSGVCKQKGILRRNSSLLHRSLMQAIKKQLQGLLPKAQVKDALISGDVAVAIRFPEVSGDSGGASSSSSTAPPPRASCDCRVFLLAKTVLRPEYGVFMEMDVDMAQRQASLRAHPDTGISCICSFDLAADLLNNLPPASSLWVNVLVHKPVLLGLCLGQAGL